MKPLQAQQLLKTAKHIRKALTIARSVEDYVLAAHLLPAYRALEVALAKVIADQQKLP